MGWGYGWRPYVPVAERRRKALQKAEKMKKKGQVISPVENVGRNIAATFWGKAWCDNLEAYSDYANRLPRGRTYVRNGSVIDLQLREGQVEALVSGSDLYSVKITINPLKTDAWKAIQKECAGRIASLVDLLAGRLSGSVMEIVTKKQTGLFPMPQEMSFQCSCPDWASMCKHVAAVLYGVGARLDHSPELLFGLRGVDHGELVCAQSAVGTAVSAGVREKMIAEDQLSEIFGIDIDTEVREAQQPPAKKPAVRPKTVPAKEKITQGVKRKKTAKTAEKKKETSVVKKTKEKETQPESKKKAGTPAKKRVTVTSRKTGNKGKRQPPKKTAAKKATKKLPPTPNPIRGRKPKSGKVETKPKA
jgi:uncharacterized Zn finger protein